MWSTHDELLHNHTSNNAVTERSDTDGAKAPLCRADPPSRSAAATATELSPVVTRVRTPVPAPDRKPRSVVADVLDGLRFVWDHVAARCLMIWGGLLNFAGGTSRLPGAAACRARRGPGTWQQGRRDIPPAPSSYIA